MRLMVLGATGRTGQHLVRQALTRHHAVTALVRSPSKLTLRHECLEIVRGDPRDPDQLRRRLWDREAVISALGVTSRRDGDVLASAARATVAAMREAGLRRLIVVSQALLYPDVGPLGPLLRVLLRHHLRASAAMEEVVRASGLDWTIVRPPRLTNGAPTGRYRLSHEQAPPGFTISRADLASAILDEVERPAHVGMVMGVSG